MSTTTTRTDRAAVRAVEAIERLGGDALDTITEALRRRAAEHIEHADTMQQVVDAGGVDWLPVPAASAIAHAHRKGAEDLHALADRLDSAAEAAELA